MGCGLYGGQHENERYDTAVNLLYLTCLWLFLGGVALATMGDQGGFNGGAAGGAGSGGGATSTLNSVVHLTPNAGSGVLSFTPISTDHNWIVEYVNSLSGTFEIVDMTNSYAPFFCNPLTGGVDGCSLTGNVDFKAATDPTSNVLVNAPTGIGGTNFVTLPGPQVTGGYWKDSDGAGTMVEFLPILTTTSASLNHGGVNIAANSCENESATTLTGTTTGMVCDASPTADPGTAFTWTAICGSGAVTVRICNISAAGATPTATTYNIRVIK